MFKHRTAAAFVCLFALGVVAAALISPPDTASFCTVFAVLFAVFSAVILFLRGKAGKKYRIAAALAFAFAAFSFGALRVGISQAVASGLSAYGGKNDIITVKAVSVNRYSHSCVIDGGITDSELSVPYGTAVRLRIYEYEGETPLPGDLVHASARYSQNIGRDLLAEGLKLEARGGVIASARGSGLLYEVRNGVISECGEFFTDGAASAAAKAVTVGDRSGLDPHVYSVYSNAGISHLLAISGLHISLVTSALFSLLLAFGLNKRVCGVAGAVFSLMYAALVGFTPGVLRAALMTCALMAARMFNYRADSVTSLFAALFVLALYNPYTLFSAGTMLSFSCCLGVVFVSPYIERFGHYTEEKRLSGGVLRSVAYRLLYIVTAPAAVTLAASLFSFPATFLHFERVSYISPPANIIAVPLYSIAIMLSLAAVSVGALVPAFGKVLAVPAGWLFNAVTDSAKALYSTGIGSVTLRTDIMRVPLFCALAVVAVLLFVRKNRLKAMLVSALCFVLVFASCALINRARVKNTAVLEYGGGEREYVYFSADGMNCYIDLGGYRSRRECVFNTGSSSLDFYVVASADERAASRFEELSGRMRVRKVFLPESAETAGICGEIKLLAKSRGCDIISYAPDQGVKDYSGGAGFIIENGASAISFESSQLAARVFNGEGSGGFCDAALFTRNLVSAPEKLYCSLLCLPEGASAAGYPAQTREYKETVRITRKTGESEIITDDPGYS